MEGAEGGTGLHEEVLGEEAGEDHVTPEAAKMKKRKRKYDITIDGYRIRNDADFDRVDMNKAERKDKHRKAKLLKREETNPAPETSR